MHSGVKYSLKMSDVPCTTHRHPDCRQSAVRVGSGVNWSLPEWPSVITHAWHTEAN